jgi:pyroglutamyl-peptidase
VVTVVQGFGPFGEFPANPSEILVDDLGARSGPELVTEVVTVSRDQVTTAVAKLMEQHRPTVWLGVGLAAGRPALSLEAVAVNLADWSAEHADADGVVVTRRPVVEGGPAAHLTTLPVAEILAAWSDEGIPGYLSQTAGSYLCNLSFYAAAQVAVDLGIDCRVGFVHLPLLPEQVTRPDRQPSMARSLQAAGLDAVLRACALAPPRSGLHADVPQAQEPTPGPSDPEAAGMAGKGPIRAG